MMYGWSVTHCLPTQLVEQPSAAIGTVIRADTVHDLATQASFSRRRDRPADRDRASGPGSRGCLRRRFGIPSQSSALAAFATEVAGLDDPIDLQYVREFQLSTTTRPLSPRLLNTFVAESQKVPARIWREVTVHWDEPQHFVDDLVAFVHTVRPAGKLAG